MAAETGSGLDITAAPRAVLRESVRLLYRVLGEERLRTARGNAWEAVLADRENARWRHTNVTRRTPKIPPSVPIRDRESAQV